MCVGGGVRLKLETRHCCTMQHPSLVRGTVGSLGVSLRGARATVCLHAVVGVCVGGGGGVPLCVVIRRSAAAPLNSFDPPRDVCLQRCFEPWGLGHLSSVVLAPAKLTLLIFSTTLSGQSKMAPSEVSRRTVSGLLPFLLFF